MRKHLNRKTSLICVPLDRSMPLGIIKGASLIRSVLPKRGRYAMTKIKPYPPEYARNLDFLPIISVQRALGPKQELYYFSGTVSVPFPKVSTVGKPIKTELGGTIRSHPIMRNASEIRYGKPEPTGFKCTQEEIHEEITSVYQLPEAVINQRGKVEKVPKIVEDFKQLQGVDELYSQETSRGNFCRKFRRMFGLKFFNPYRAMKNELVEYGIVKPSDPCFKRLRSVLTVDWIIGHRKGWSDFLDILFQLEQALCTDKWWQDTAVPHPISDTIDSRLIQAQIYLLDKRDELIAI